jgi:cold shock CspA family protein
VDRLPQRDNKNRIRGSIIRVFPARGYGFISGDDGSEVFFHRTAVVDDDFLLLLNGDRVSFVPTVNGKGASATEVVKEWPLDEIRNLVGSIQIASS